MISKNELPKSWGLVKLSELTEKISDGPFGSNLKSGDYVSEGVRVVRLENIGVLEFKDQYKTFVTEEKYLTISSHTVTKGDIIFSSFIADQIRVTILPNYIEKAINKADCFCIRVSENKISRKFLVFYLATKALYNQLVKEVHGATRPRINTKQLKSSLIPLPPLAEQERIVAKIEELFSELDAGLESLKTAQAQLKTYRQAVLKYAFEGKLTNDDVNEGELPNGWKWKKLSDLTEKISDGPFGSNLKSVDYVDEGVRVIRLENIGVLEFKDEYKTFVTEEKYETISRHTVTKGDIIFSSFVADQIRVTILPDFVEKAINKADCFCVRTSENTINRKYLVFFLATKSLYNQLVNEVHGATRPRINTTQLKSSLVPVCSLEEQQRIVEEIESRLSVCDKLEETINASLKQAEALRQSILKQAFEGKLVKEPIETARAVEAIKHKVGIKN